MALTWRDRIDDNSKKSKLVVKLTGQNGEMKASMRGSL